MEESTRRPQPSSSLRSGRTLNNQVEADLDRAVERVYRLYGGDLSAFFRAAVHDQVQLRQSGKENRDDCALSAGR